ncbi:hypothetical protein [Caballeronia ptereochthonis]|uniref:hypothetical protein n=1 Tax=Caballeronia ptereochthonis TaxID=1777144 RepID=UPI00117CB2E6|nr:hypothetical protein [Caballeronia ptereochthonis]
MSLATRPHPLSDARAMRVCEVRTATLTCCAEFAGYRLTADAPRAHAHLYSADLLIEGPNHTHWSFRALDFFYDPAEALAYSIEWGRLWVENNEHEVATRGRRPDSVF